MVKLLLYGALGEVTLESDVLSTGKSVTIGLLNTNTKGNSLKAHADSVLLLFREFM